MQTITRAIRKDGIEIATEAFGDPAHAPVLLRMGGMAWDPIVAAIAEHTKMDRQR